MENGLGLLGGGHGRPDYQASPIDVQMMSLLALPFIALVIWDMVLTYQVISTGKGREMAFAKRYIKNKRLTILITLIGILLILLLTAETPLILILPIVAFGYACWKNWGVLHG